jgi:gliding motility-associated-like protein
VTCYGLSNGYANVQAAGGTAPYTYAWSGSGSVDSFATDLAAGAQTVTVHDHNGCTASATFSIGQPTQIVVTTATVDAHCSTSNDGRATASVSGGSPGYTYSWDGTAGGITDSTLTTGNHTLLVTDSKGCTQTTTFTIGVQYTLAVTVASDSVTCHGGSNGIAYVASVNGSPGYTYQWNPASSTSDSATGLMAGGQKVTVTDAYGCTAIGSTIVYEPAQITDQVYFTDPLCTGQNTGKVWVTAGGTYAPYTYTFSNATYGITDTVFNLAAGTYPITVTDAKGCTVGDAATLTDPAQLNVPAPDVTGIRCANDANGAIALNPTGGTQPYVYNWSPGGSTASQQSNLGPATYDVTVSDANGCSVTVSVTLSAPSRISFFYIESDSTSCPDSTDGHIVVDATGGTPGNNVLYQYAINGGAYQTNHNFYNLLAGVYTISVMDSPGCVADTTIIVSQPLPVSVSVTPFDSIISPGATIQLFSVLNNPAGATINSYTWTPGTGLSCIDCPDPHASPYQATQYTLMVNYGRNCTTTTTNSIEVGNVPSTYIPNAFTPNGDGVDDQFTAFGSGLSSVAMTVYNRWGEKVFDSGDSQWASWDGTYKGAPQPTGVYVYYVTLVYLNGHQETKEGSLTLIR